MAKAMRRGMKKGRKKGKKVMRKGTTVMKAESRMMCRGCGKRRAKVDFTAKALRHGRRCCRHCKVDGRSAFNEKLNADSARQRAKGLERQRQRAAEKKEKKEKKEKEEKEKKEKKETTEKKEKKEEAARSAEQMPTVQDALVISATPLAKILAGVKRWEMKTRNRKSAVGKTYALLPKGTNAVWGFARVAAVHFVSWDELQRPGGQDHPESGCTEADLRSYAAASKPATQEGLWALTLADVKALPKPFPLPRELSRRTSCWDKFPRSTIPREIHDSAEEVRACEWQEKRMAILESGGQESSSLQGRSSARAGSR